MEDEEVKVSELPEATSVSGEDLVMIIQNSANKKTTVEKVSKQYSAVTSGTITPITGETLSSASYVKKSGNNVDFFASFSGTAISADTRTNIGNISSGFRPSHAFVCNASYSYGFGSTGGEQHPVLVYFQSNGDIDILSHDNIQSSHNIRIKTSYIKD